MFRLTASSLIKIALISVAVVALTGGTALAQTATVTGTVTDAATGLPIEGAFVTLRPADGCSGGGGSQFHGGDHGWGHGGGSGSGGGGGMGGHHGGGAGMATRVQTDADGVYVFESLEADDYLVRACACGYVPTDLTPVTVAEGETVVQDFELDPR